MTQANSHDRNGGRLYQAGEVVDCVLTVSWVTRTVGDEDAINFSGNLVDRVVVWQHGHSRSSADQAAQDVLLHSTIDQGNVEGGVRSRHDKGRLGADLLHKIDLAGIEETLVFVGIVFVTDGDPGKRGTLLPKMRDDGTRVDTRDGGYTLPGAPIAQALHRGPVAILLGHIRDDDSSALDVRRLEVLEKIVLVPGARGDTVVADEGLGEDEDLATVRGIGHGFRVADQGGGEDGLSRDVGVGTKGSSVEDGTILRES